MQTINNHRHPLKELSLRAGTAAELMTSSPVSIRQGAPFQERSMSCDWRFGVVG
jgi:hypothetical protein